MWKYRVLVLTATFLVLSTLCFLSFLSDAKAVIGSTTQTFTAIADSCVNASSPDTNYGNSTLQMSSPPASQYAYLMFDFSSLPSGATIISARVSVFLAQISGSTGSIDMYYCPNDNWTEFGINWNNKPVYASTPSSSVSYGMFVTYNTYYSWDVTSDVRNSLGRGKVTEVLVDNRASSASRFQSREEGNKPKLDIEYTMKTISSIHFESIRDVGGGNNIGFVTIADYEVPLPADIDFVTPGTYQIRYSNGYRFVRWETSGGITVANVKEATTTITVSGIGTLRAVGSSSRVEYSYDPDIISAIDMKDVGTIDAVRFTPLFSGQLLLARFSLDGVYSFYNNTLKVHVMDSSFRDLVPPFLQTPTKNGWFDVDLSSYGISIDAYTDFHIGMEWITGNRPYLNKHGSTENPDRSWRWDGTNWKQDRSAEFMIRAVVGAIPVYVISPRNGMYSTNNVSLTFTIGMPTDWMGYSIDGQENSTITENTTLTNLPDGVHYLVVFCNSTNGSIGESDTVQFAIDTTPPNVTDISQIPMPTNVSATDEVRINATVTDATSGVNEVILNYTTNNNTYLTISMTNLGGHVYHGTIPPLPLGTNVTYQIMAEDNVGNTITTEQLGFTHQYQVIPEFPTILVMPPFILATLLAVIIHKRKRI